MGSNISSDNSLNSQQKLTVILVLSNPCNFKRRKELFDDCLHHMIATKKKTSDLNIVVARFISDIKKYIENCRYFY